MATTTREQTNPYVGPRPFEIGESLYGRDDELYRLVNLLIAKRIILLYSPSGAGKTSLVQAGLIPRLEGEGFNVLPVIRVNLDIGSPELVSTNRYVVSTVSSLDPPLPPTGQVSLPDLAGMDLSTYLDRRPRGSQERGYDVLIFDQFEELLTLDPTDHVAKDAFMVQVGEALRDRRRWAVFAMREEFIAALEPFIRAIPTRLSATFRLDLLGEKAAQVAMQSPAASSGVTFADSAARRLVDELRRTRVQRADGAREELGPYVEPVQLQVVCRQLWERLPPDVTEITDSHVVDLGDVNTALAEYYEERVQAVVDRTAVPERAVRDWFDHITEQGFRTQVLTGPEGGGGHDRAVLDVLQDAHLIRAEQRRGATWFELAHDRLIAPVRASNAQWRARTLTAFQRAAVTWREHDRSDTVIPPDAVLDEAEPWLVAHEHELTQGERDFVAACERVRAQRARSARQARRTRNLAVVASIVSVMALVSLGFAVVNGNEARHQGALASARELARAAETTADPSLRILLAQEAVKRAGSGREPVVRDATESLYKALYHATPSPLFTLPTREVTSVAATSDGRYLATAGQGAGHRDVEIWDLQHQGAAAGANAGEPVKISNSVDLTAIAFSPDGRTLAAAGGDGIGRLWDMASPGRAPVVLPHFEEVARDKEATDVTTKRLLAIAVSPDGRRVVTTGADGKAQVWDAASGRNVTSVVNKLGQAITTAAFNPRDGNQLVLANSAGRVELRDVDLGNSVRTYPAHTGAVTAAAFGADGSRLATSADNGFVIVRDPATGEFQLELPHPQAVSGLAFSPDGTRLATAGMDGRAVVWDLASGRTVAVFRPGNRPVRGLVFTRSGQLVIAADNAAPGVWEVPATPRQGHDLGLAAVAVSPQGGRAVTASADKTAGLWDTSTDRGSPRELFTLPHLGKVYAASFSSDGTRVVTASADTTAKLWDASTGKLLFTLPHAKEVIDATFSSDARRILTVSGDEAKLWDASNGGALSTLRHGGEVTAAAFNPTGSRVATASRDATATVWDASTGQALFTVQHVGSVTSLAWSADGTRLATADELGVIGLWETNAGTENVWPEAASGHVRAVKAMAFSPDGSRLVSGSADSTAAVWDVASGKQLHLLRHAGEVNDVAFSPGGRTIATAGNDSLGALWEADSGKQLARLHHRGPVNQIRFSSNGAQLFTASEDGTARGWDASSGVATITLSREVYRHTVDVSDVEFSRDGTSLATASDDGTARVWVASEPSSDPRRQLESPEAPGLLWDVAARTDSRTVARHAASVYEVSLSPDGGQLATASEDHTARIWDVASGTLLHTLVHADAVSDVAFSPDGKTIATASFDRTAALWDTEGRPLHPPLAHNDVVYSVMFSPDGARVATASEDKTVTIWDVKTGTVVGKPVMHEGAVVAAVYNRRGDAIATASGASVKIVDAGGDHRVLRELGARSGESGEAVDLTSVTFSRDDRLIAAGTVDGIVVWEVATGKQVLAVSQGGMVRAVSFGTDGRLALAGAGNDFYVYDLKPAPTMVRKAAGRSLSMAECERFLLQNRC